MASTTITGRDYKNYERTADTSGGRPIRVPYESDNSIATAEGVTGSYEGKASLFNRYYTFYYSGAFGHAATNSINYFDDSDAGWRPLEVERNPTSSRLIEWSRSGKNKNAIEYAWEDFLYCKNYGKVPNNYMVTLRRFGTPVSDNLINVLRQSSPDVGRLVCWMDGDKNKLEDLLKFSVKLNWKEFKSSIQSVQGSGYGGSGGGSLFGKILGATDTKGSSNAAKGSNRNHDPHSNMTNKTMGPINVIDKMQVRERGMDFEQQIKLVFEYEMRSIDGINGKMAMLDLIMNVLMVTYNRGDFWGGAIRYTGGSRTSNPIAGQEGMAKLAAGDYGGFLDSLSSGLTNRLNDLTGGKGFSLEGIGNALKSVGGNIASRAAGSAMDKMGRPQAQATMALLSGEDTGEWHVTIGNPARPILSLGNMILEGTELQLSGPLDKDDFPTKLSVTCTLKPARPRDRDDVQMMFAPNNMARLYSSALDYVKSTYAGQIKGQENIGVSNSTPTSEQDPVGGITTRDAEKMNVEESKFNKDIKNRFPNHEQGTVDNAVKWTT